MVNELLVPDLVGVLMWAVGFVVLRQHGLELLCGLHFVSLEPKIMLGPMLNFTEQVPRIEAPQIPRCRRFFWQDIHLPQMAIRKLTTILIKLPSSQYHIWCFPRVIHRQWHLKALI